MMLSIQITQFKFCQFQMRAISPNSVLTKVTSYTVKMVGYSWVPKSLIKRLEIDCLQTKPRPRPIFGFSILCVTCLCAKVKCLERGLGD